MMNIENSDYHLIQPKDYQTKPWKNGLGTTQDILLLPEGADHSSFEVRFALSPILESGKFSSFPGSERIITVVDGIGLELAFEDKTNHLNLGDSLRFDTGLAPIGTPIDGAVRVLNVMARRSIWEIIECKIIDILDTQCQTGEIVLLFSLSEGCEISINQQTVALAKGHALFMQPKNNLDIKYNKKNMLFAHLKSSRCM